MSKFKICLQGKDVQVVANGVDTPEDYVEVGTFDHPDDELDALGYHGNHVLYHHVRDALYPLGIWDMAFVTITFDPTPAPVPDPVTDPEEE